LLNAGGHYFTFGAIKQRLPDTGKTELIHSQYSCHAIQP